MGSPLTAVLSQDLSCWLWGTGQGLLGSARGRVFLASVPSRWRGTRHERDGVGLTVTELVSAAADGDGRAWGEIVARYGDLVRATVAGFRLQQADAADAMQNTWLRALERIGTVGTRSGSAAG